MPTIKDDWGAYQPNLTSQTLPASPVWAGGAGADISGNYGGVAPTVTPTGPTWAHDTSTGKMWFFDTVWIDTGITI